MVSTIPAFASDNPSLQAKFDTLFEDDLAFAKNRLIDQQGLSKEEAESCGEEFLQFASLIFMADGQLVPTKKADEFWHAMILHTKQYREWCNRHYGKFIDHNPGSTPAEAWSRSRSLAKRVFGVDWPANAKAKSCCDLSI